MSFSMKVKEELAIRYGQARHCQLAELAALAMFSGSLVKKESEKYELFFQLENEEAARKCFTLLEKAFNIKTEILDNRQRDQIGIKNFIVRIEQIKDAEEVLNAIKQVQGRELQQMIADPLLLRSTCCKRAFLRGAYLCAGSMSTPEKSYHLEFVTLYSEIAEQIKDILADFEIEAKVIQRKKYYVVYIKEGTAIGDLLNVMEAHISLMEFENLRIVKDVRNSVNRRVNCETANISKTVNAASKQIEDIQLVQNEMGFQNLPASLREIAEIRLQYPEATLNELGQYLKQPVGKSGVNHRLRKLGEIAENIRSIRRETV